MSQLVCPKCSEKGFLLTIARPSGLDCIISSDPVGTLECPRCHTTMEFRACALPILPQPGIQYPLQRFECREHMGRWDPMRSMRPSSNGEWIRYEEHATLMKSRENTNSQLAGKLVTLHAQWEQQKKTITYLSEEIEELKKKLQVSEVQKTQAQIDLAREQRDRWMRQVYEASGMPVQDPFQTSFNRGFQPGAIFNKPFPSHAEVTIKHLNERILEQGKELGAFLRTHTAVVGDLTAELAACRSNLKQAEQERDREKAQTRKFREAEAARVAKWPF